ncbi:MAG TPA: site-2 protease family protein [Candidatus Acidoferrales bacterium]|nr:site-2 protease family protein [Candidatus Acidoferrales bacterium]
MDSGNGSSRPPIELLDDVRPRFLDPTQFAAARRKRPFALALILFVLTVISTLAVGREFSLSYAQNRAPFAGLENPFAPTWQALMHPQLLLQGLPFSLTLISILLVHELGHFFACRYYGIDSSYPYFLPAPTLIGTFGAFIRIRSPILNRKALFDVGISGPVAGFVLALPILAAGVYFSKIVPGAQRDALVIFGNPPLMKLFIALFHPGVKTSDVLLTPMALAAWVGLFATALNLLPMGQLDGGHIVYSLSSEKHRRISQIAGIALLLMAVFFWHGWIVFAVLTFFLGYRHPLLLDSWTPLDRTRRAWATIALVIFLLCFTPMPISNPPL